MTHHPIPPETLAWFGGDELRARIFYEKYALRNEQGQASETTPAQMWGRVAQGLAAVEHDETRRAHWASEFRWLLDGFRFIPGGRILHAIGNPHKVTALNCYYIPIHTDSLSSIFHAAEEAARTHARGGGVGLDISVLRPAGALVHNAARTSTSAVSFMELYSQETGLIGQSGRRGATLISIRDSHPDVLAFCAIKRNRTSVRFANISVKLSNPFMEAVAADDTWLLHFENPEAGVLVKREIPARQLWDELILGARDYAEPGCLFWSTVERRGTSQYGGMQVAGVNPCVVGETLVSTSQGMIPIAKLATTRRHDLPGATLDARVSPHRAFGAISSAWRSGRKPVYRLSTIEGYELRATGDHRILTSNRGWVRLAHLRPGDELLIQNRKGGFGSVGSEALGRIWGWLIADGFVSGRSAVLSFYGDKRKLAPLFQDAVRELVPSTARYPAPSVQHIPSHNRSQIDSMRLLSALTRYGFNPVDKYALPRCIWQGTEDTVRGFIQSLFTADGTILSASESRRSVRLSSIHKPFLRDVQRLLTNFGIQSRLYADRRPGGSRALPDGKGGSRPYPTQPLHELAISATSIATFAKEIGFLPLSTKATTLERLTAAYTRGPYIKPSTARVTQVAPDGVEDVYDLTEDASHTFIANGLTISNCAEQSLEPYGACDLGSLNLLTFCKTPFAPTTPKENVDWHALSRAVHVGIRFLDNVLDWNRGRHALPEQEEAALRSRRVGLGVTGLGDLLIALGLRYGSPEAIRFTDRLFERIKVEAYLASAGLAKEKDPFPAFDEQEHLHQPFLRDLPNSLQEMIARDGLRNVALMTVPPVGTGAALAGVTSGIEPIFALSYLRKSESLTQGEFLVLHPLAARYWAEHVRAPLPSAEQFNAEARRRLPEAFVTAHELDWRERVDTQATIQRHIDNAISSTCNLPHDVSLDTVGALYRHAWQAGCKGISVYREGSREGILLTHDQVAREGQEQLTVRLARAVTRLAGPVLPATAKVSRTPTDAELERLEHAITQLLTTGTGQLPLLGTTPPLRPRPTVLRGITFAQPAPEGSIQVTVNEVNEEPFELIAHGGKAGSDILAWVQALARTASILLRLQRLPSQRERVQLLIEQWGEIAGSRSIGFGPNKVRSGPDGMAQALLRYLELRARPNESPLPALSEPATPTHSQTTNGNCCPNCRSFSLITDEGCLKCQQCGFKEC